MGVNPGHRPKHETVFALLHVRRSHPSCIVETSPMNSACCRLSTQASCFIHSCFACFLSAFRRGGGPSDWVIVGHFEWRRTCCFSEGLWFSPFFKKFNFVKNCFRHAVQQSRSHRTVSDARKQKLQWRGKFIVILLVSTSAWIFLISFFFPPPMKSVLRCLKISDVLSSHSPKD